MLSPSLFISLYFWKFSAQPTCQRSCGFCLTPSSGRAPSPWACWRAPFPRQQPLPLLQPSTVEAIFPPFQLLRPSSPSQPSPSEPRAGKEVCAVSGPRPSPTSWSPASAAVSRAAGHPHLWVARASAGSWRGSRSAGGAAILWRFAGCDRYSITAISYRR